MEIPDIRKQKYLSYVRKIAAMFGLKDWTFEIGNDEPQNKTALASIWSPAGRKYGYIRFTQHFIDATKEEQRMIVVHELTHCHLAMEFQMSQDHIAEDKRAIHQTLMEYGVDGIAMSISTFFPLPE